MTNHLVRSVKYKNISSLFSNLLFLLGLLIGTGCGGSGGSSGSGTTDSVTIAPIEGINSSNVSRLVIEGTCYLEGSSDNQEDTTSEPVETEGDAEGSLDNQIDQKVCLN